LPRDFEPDDAPITEFAAMIEIPGASAAPLQLGAAERAVGNQNLGPRPADKGNPPVAVALHHVMGGERSALIASNLSQSSTAARVAVATPPFGGHGR